MIRLSRLKCNELIKVFPASLLCLYIGCQSGAGRSVIPDHFESGPGSAASGRPLEKGENGSNLDGRSYWPPAFFCMEDLSLPCRDDGGIAETRATGNHLFPDILIQVSVKRAWG
jgi:hypothetical protein